MRIETWFSGKWPDDYGNAIKERDKAGYGATAICSEIDAIDHKNAQQGQQYQYHPPIMLLLYAAVKKGAEIRSQKEYGQRYPVVADHR